MKSLFDSINELSGGDTVTRYPYRGYISTGGHHMHVFDAAEEITAVVRPWQSDMGQQANEGMTGQTPGVKIYVPEGHGLTREDRIEYNGGAFRMQNPQFDQMAGLERWDGQTDERTRRLYDDLDPALQDEIQPPDTDGYGGH